MVKLFVWNIVLLFGLLALAHSYAQQNMATLTAQHLYETEQVCDNAVTVGSFKTCYQVETQYNTEYLCNSNQSNCWVEAK